MLCTSNIAIQMQYSAAYCDYHEILWVTLLATLHHVVGWLSCNNPHLHWYLSFNYFRWKEGKPAEKKFSSRGSNFHNYFTRKKKKLFLESSVSDIKKPVTNAVLENTKKLKKYAVNVFNFKSQIVLAKHKCSTIWGDCKSKRGNWSTRRKTSQSRVENQQTRFVFQP